MWVVTLPGTVFGPMSQSDPWLWHVSCDIAWNSLWANVTIRPLIVTCGMWHCLRESLGQCHNHTKSWLWDWPKDCSRQCHNSHVTITRVIVTLAQRLFQAMSHLTCHNIWVGVKKLQKSSSWGGGPTTHIQVVWQGPKSFKIFLLFKQNPFFHFLKLLIFVVFGCWRSDKWCY